MDVQRASLTGGIDLHGAQRATKPLGVIGRDVDALHRRHVAALTTTHRALDPASHIQLVGVPANLQALCRHVLRRLLPEGQRPGQWPRGVGQTKARARNAAQRNLQITACGRYTQREVQRQIGRRRLVQRHRQIQRNTAQTGVDGQ